MDADEVPEQLKADVHQMLCDGHNVVAIEHVRSHSELGLAEAKHLVDQMCQEFDYRDFRRRLRRGEKEN